MADAFVVLAASTPPDPRKAVAMFIVGATQNAADAEARANTFKSSHEPTGTVQPCTVDSYNTDVIVAP